MADSRSLKVLDLFDGWSVVQQDSPQVVSDHPSSETLKLKAEEALAWVALARKPITINALLHALATRVDSRLIRNRDLLEEDELLEACRGWLTVDSQSLVISFVSNKVKEEVQAQLVSLKRQWHLRMTRTLLSYLKLDGLRILSLPLDELPKRYPLLVYAASYWGKHAQISIEELEVEEGLRDEREEIFKEVKLFLQSMPEVALSQTHLWWEKYHPMAKQTNLHVAAHFGLHQVIERLQPSSNAANAFDLTGYTPLKRAVITGSEETVRVLLRFGARDMPSESPNFFAPSAIALACEIGDTPILKMLLESDPDIKFENEDDPVNLIASALVAKSKESVKLLLQLLDEPKKRSQVASKLLEQFDEFPFYKMNRLDKQPDLDLSLDLLLQAFSPEEFSEQSRASALCRFAASPDLGKISIIRRLLDYGADINGRNAELQTPLMCASSPELINTETISILLDAGADISLCDSKGRTAVHHAIHSDLQDVAVANLELLLQSGGAVDTQDNKGNTPLITAGQLAPKLRNLWIQPLLQHHADTSVVNAKNRTALQYACFRTNLDAVTLLLKHDQNLSEKKKKAVYEVTKLYKTMRTDPEWFDKVTAAAPGIDLHLVTEFLILGHSIVPIFSDDDDNYSYKMTKLLLNAGADIHATDEWDRTPLAKACESNRMEMAKFLLKNGADIYRDL